MKRRILALILATTVVCGMFTGCGSMNVSSTGQGSNLGDTVSSENDSTGVSEENDSEGIQQDELQELTWVPLYELNDFQDTLRTPMEHAVNQGYYIYPEIKEGVFYHTVLSSYKLVKNNTLMHVLNHAYNASGSFEKEETIQALADAACNTYTDLEEGDTMTNFYMALNGYFNLLPDVDPSCANPNKNLTRAEFMALVMRAETPVDSDLTVNPDFESAVGESPYNLYAQKIEKDCYMNISDGTLNSKTYNEAITRAEAIYVIMNHYLADWSEYRDVSTHIVGFTDVEEDSLPADIYKELVYADYYGYLETEVRPHDVITKVEAIEFLAEVYSHLGYVFLRAVESEEYTMNNIGGLSPNSQGFIIMDEDTNGDGLLDYNEAKADGWKYHKLYYTQDGKHTYRADIRNGQIIFPGDTYKNDNGDIETWYGTTPEDIALVESQIFKD